MSPHLAGATVLRPEAGGLALPAFPDAGGAWRPRGAEATAASAAFDERPARGSSVAAGLSGRGFGPGPAIGRLVTGPVTGGRSSLVDPGAFALSGGAVEARGGAFACSCPPQRGGGAPGAP